MILLKFAVQKLHPELHRELHSELHRELQTILLQKLHIEHDRLLSIETPLEHVQVLFLD